MDEKQKESESKAGIGAQRRGQQMGDERSTMSGTRDPQREDTPALRGNRPEANEHFADASMQQVGSDGATPRSNTPSTPAAIPVDTPFGQSGGEQAFNSQSPSANQKKN